MANDVRYRILASVVGAQAIDGLKKSVDATAKSADGINSKFGSAAGAVKAFAAAFVASTAVQYVKGLIDIGDELAALSEKTGIASNQLYGFKIAASTANLDIGQLSSGLKKFTQNLGSILAGNREVSAALASVGVAAKNQDGTLRASGDVIVDLAGKFEKLKDGPEKARLAVALFGKQGSDLIPFLNQGSAALQEFSNALSPDFADRADALNDSLAILGAKVQVISINAVDTLLPALQEISSAFVNLPSDGKEAVGALDLVGEAFRLLAIGIQGLTSLTIDTFDLIQANARGLAAQLEYIFGGIGRTISTVFQQAVALAKADLDEAYRIQREADQKSLDAIRKKDAEIEKLESGLVARQKSRAESTKQFYDSLAKNSLILGEGTVDEIKQRQREATAVTKRPTGTTPDVSSVSKSTDSEVESIKKYIAVQAQQIDQERLKLEQYRLSKVEYDKLIESKRIDIEVTKASAGFTEENKKKYLEAAEAVKAQRLALIELEQAQRESFSVGIQQSLNEYIDGVKDVASQTKKLFSDAFQGMEDALIKFTKTGKLNFTDLANSIIDDLIRISIRQGITGPLASALGSAFGGDGAGFSFSGATADVFFNANGGIVGPNGSMKLNKYASGGVANSPQVAVFGEGRMPEAYVPLPDGRSIPVNMKGASGGDVFNINVVVQDGGAPQASGNSPSAADFGKAISSAVQAEIIKQKRSGGLLA